MPGQMKPLRTPKQKHLAARRPNPYTTRCGAETPGARTSSRRDPNRWAWHITSQRARSPMNRRADVQTVLEEIQILKNPEVENQGRKLWRSGLSESELLATKSEVTRTFMTQETQKGFESFVYIRFGGAPRFFSEHSSTQYHRSLTLPIRCISCSDRRRFSL